MRVANTLLHLITTTEKLQNHRLIAFSAHFLKGTLRPVFSHYVNNVVIR